MTSVVHELVTFWIKSHYNQIQICSLLTKLDEPDPSEKKNNNLDVFTSV